MFTNVINYDIITPREVRELAKKTRKCQYCKIDDTLKEDMEFEMVGIKKPVAKFYHKDCFQKHLEDKAFKEEERKKKDELNEVIKEIYGVKEVPNSAWVLLEKLRNGEPIFGPRQKMNKRYKEGYDYILIKETFEYCSDTIEYYNGLKDFNGFMGAFKYALSIIIDKIYIVEKRMQEKEHQRTLMKKHEIEVDMDVSSHSNYKKPSKSNTDISSFLDD